MTRAVLIIAILMIAHPAAAQFWPLEHRHHKVRRHAVEPVQEPDCPQIREAVKVLGLEPDRLANALRKAGRARRAIIEKCMTQDQ